ncbi:tungstate ABC transporter substrate-binding protein WtpA [bacterium]|nr:tungstate ABC transporter substrate-binding protein WtpA [bacterium]
MVIVFLLSGDLKTGQAKDLDKANLIIFHAGSLAGPFKTLEEQFEKAYPDVDVLRESLGSRLAARSVSELDKEADIVAVSDYRVIIDILMPKDTNWYLCWASNQMVIMYSENSKYAKEINSNNWYKILLRKGVNYGHSDPNLDPCGYRSLFVWQLAERYYQLPGLYKKLSQNCPSKNIRPKETDLIALVEIGELDYVFSYSSIAKQHRLSFVKLPDEINLEKIRLKEDYKKASLKISGQKPGTYTKVFGEPIIYALTIPRNAPNKDLAYKFISYLLSKEGEKVFLKSGQSPITPAIVNNLKYLPKELRHLNLVSNKDEEDKKP